MSRINKDLGMGLEEIWTRELKQKAVSKETALILSITPYFIFLLFLNKSFRSFPYFVAYFNKIDTRQIRSRINYFVNRTASFH